MGNFLGVVSIYKLQNYPNENHHSFRQTKVRYFPDNYYEAFYGDDW